jgi:DNA polymerase I
MEHGQPIKPGSVIGYIITTGGGSISQRAEPFEYANTYDPDYYIHNQIMPAAMRILSGLGIREEDILGEEEDQSQRSLDAFVRKSLKSRMMEGLKGKRGEKDW